MRGIISRKCSLFIIGSLLFLCPLHINAKVNSGFSQEVAAFMETNGMTVFEDPEIKAIQAELAGFGQVETEDLTEEERKKATDLVDHLLSSIERVAREYMSGKRTSANPVYTVQDYKELTPCVDDGDGSCFEAKQQELTKQPQQPQQPQQPELTQQPEQLQQAQQPEQPAAEEKISFGAMLNKKRTDSLEAIRQNLKL